MAAHTGEKSRTVSCHHEVAAEHGRGEVVSDGEPGAFGPLAAVEGIFAAHAFAPAVDSVAMRGEQKDAAAVGASKARLEEMDERHVNLAESDGFNLHNSRASAFRLRASANPMPATSNSVRGSLRALHQEILPKPDAR